MEGAGQIPFTSTARKELTSALFWTFPISRLYSFFASSSRLLASIREIKFAPAIPITPVTVPSPGTIQSIGSVAFMMACSDSLLNLSPGRRTFCASQMTSLNVSIRCRNRFARAVKSASLIFWTIRSEHANAVSRALHSNTPSSCSTVPARPNASEALSIASQNRVISSGNSHWVVRAIIDSSSS